MCKGFLDNLHIRRLYVGLDIRCRPCLLRGHEGVQILILTWVIAQWYIEALKVFLRYLRTFKPTPPLLSRRHSPDLVIPVKSLIGIRVCLKHPN